MAETVSCTELASYQHPMKLHSCSGRAGKHPAPWEYTNIYQTLLLVIKQLRKLTADYLQTVSWDNSGGQRWAGLEGAVPRVPIWAPSPGSRLCKALESMTWDTSFNSSCGGISFCCPNLGETYSSHSAQCLGVLLSTAPLAVQRDPLHDTSSAPCLG